MTIFHNFLIGGKKMTTVKSSIQPVNPLLNLWDIISAPGLALERVSTVQTRSWWLPALLSLIAPLVHVALSMDLQLERVKQGIAMSLSAMPPDQAEAARPMMERMLQPNALLLSTLTQVVLGLLISWAIAMLILYFGIALMGTPPKTSGLWAAIVWTWIPFAIRPLVQLAWNYITNSLILYPGLSYFVASGDMATDQRNPLYVAAVQIDLFALWHVVLIYVLLRVVGKLGGGSSFFLTLLYSAIMLGLHVVPTMITTFMSPG
jgi:hypothetical protein